MSKLKPYLFAIGVTVVVIAVVFRVGLVRKAVTGIA